MSHFTVAVIMDGTKTLDEMMAPYQEYGCEDMLDDSYLEFHDVRDEERDGWETDTMEFVYKDGDLYRPWSDVFRNPDAPAWLLHGSNSHKVPDDLPRVEIPVKLLYPRYEDYLTEYGGNKVNEETGGIGYWENPNARWDWFMTWDERGWSNDFLGGPRCRIGDVGADRDALRAKAAEEYDRLKAGDDGLMSYFRTRDMTREQFIESEGHFHCRAVITNDGVWHEVGEMGWFGMSPESADEMYDWDIHFEERFIETADPDWYIVLVDCHI